MNELLDLFKLSEGLNISERKGLNGSMERIKWEYGKKERKGLNGSMERIKSEYGK